MRNKMDELLNKYWDGKTTLDEEKFIRTYFREGDILGKHQPYAALFNYFDEESKLTFVEKNRDETYSIKKKAFPGWRIAASVAVIVAMGALVYWNVSGSIHKEHDVWAAYEVEDPEKAKEVAIDALAFLSGKLQDGKDNVRTNLKTLNRLPVK